MFSAESVCLFVCFLSVFRWITERILMKIFGGVAVAQWPSD